MRFMRIKLATLLLLAIPAVAQTPQVPNLSRVEKMALTELRKEFQDIQTQQNEASANLREFLTAVEKNHPGYTIDPSTGNLVVKSQEKQAVKPASEK
jgi:hypothetical protein